MIVADMIADGTFDRHLADLRTEHRRRRDAMIGALERHGAGDTLQWSVPDGGLYLWCRLRGRLKASQVEAQALTESIAFVRGEVFYCDQAGERESESASRASRRRRPTTSRSGSCERSRPRRATARQDFAEALDLVGFNCGRPRPR